MIEKLKNIIKSIFFKKKNSGVVSNIFIDKDFIISKLPSNPVIIDCGAHIGMDTVQFAKITGSTLHAFEPIDEVYDSLVKNTSAFSNITTYKIALSDFDGEAEMYVSSGDSDGSSSLLKPKEHIKDHPEVLFNKMQKVKCQTLDTWAKENNIDKIDMLWLDMQGAEQKMLSVSDTMLNTVQIIHSEVSLKETYENVETYQSFKNLLLQKGFEVLLEAIPEGYDMGNVLFIRK
jgi:2-O-methyltransferase